MNNENTRNIAIVGSGPSAFFAADALIKKGENLNIHIFEKLSEPFGLVKFGVAPDHFKIKSVSKTFEKTLAKPNVHLWCNTEIGKDISIKQLKETFDAIILAYGSQTDRSLGIPGEDLSGSYTATAFVGWYNGHPEFQDLSFNLSGDTAVVIGQGNVAVDVVRILAKDVSELEGTDIAPYALDALAKSNIKHIHMVGRRGPAQAAFTDKELRELGELENVAVHVKPEDVELGAACKEEVESQSRVQRNITILQNFVAEKKQGAEKNIYIQFFASPCALSGDSELQSVTLQKNQLQGEAGSQKAVATETTEAVTCQAFFRSIGYRGLPLENIPFNERAGVYYHEKGRLLDDLGNNLNGLYAAGWIKRGPSGVIGSNKACSNETVSTLLEDLPNLPVKAPKTDVSQRIKEIHPQALAWES